MTVEDYRKWHPISYASDDGGGIMNNEDKVNIEVRLQVSNHVSSEMIKIHADDIALLYRENVKIKGFVSISTAIPKYTPLSSIPLLSL